MASASKLNDVLTFEIVYFNNAYLSILIYSCFRFPCVKKRSDETFCVVITIDSCSNQDKVTSCSVDSKAKQSKHSQEK